MTLRVNVENTISIGGNEYRIAEGGNAHRVPTSQYVPKTVIGDTSKDSNPNISVITWNDLRAGGGLSLIVDPERDINRSWFPVANTEHRGHIVLPRLVTTTADPSLAGVIPAIGELSDEIYAAWSGGTDVRKYDGSSSWGSSLHTLPDAATQMLQIFMGSTEYLVIAHHDGSGSGYTYTSDGSSFTNDAKDTKYITFWDDRLWGIDNAGQLWFASTIGTETDDAQLPLPAGYATALFTGPDAGGEEIIYCATKEGLYAHDAPNARFVQTGLQFPRFEQGGLGSRTWNGQIYTPYGMKVFEYSPQNGVYRNIGLDRDDGLLAAYVGRIEALLTTFNGLIAVVNNGNTRRSIWEYNGLGWHFKATLNSNDIEAVYAGNAYTAYRLWFSGNSLVRHLPLDVGRVNPNENTTVEYDGTQGFFGVQYPTFDANQPEADKLAVRLNVEVQNASADDNVQVSYFLNYSTTPVALGTITSNGKTPYTFQTNSEDSGLVFRQIQFNVALERGSTTTISPDVLSVSFEYRKKQPAKWGMTVTLDCRERIGNRSSETQLADLRTAVEATLKQQVVWRDRDDNEENYFMDITNMEIVEATGNNYESIVRITASEN